MMDLSYAIKTGKLPKRTQELAGMQLLVKIARGETND